MKQKQKVDVVINLFLTVIGMLTIVLGILKYGSPKTILICIMLGYAILNFIQFMLTRKSKDYESLYTVLGCIAICFLTNALNVSSTNDLSIVVLSWVGIQSVIKFIKTDYYNDRRDRMWKFRLITLVIFILTGVLTSLSFNYSAHIQVLILGYFFLINGILELFDPVVKYLISR